LQNSRAESGRVADRGKRFVKQGKRGEEEEREERVYAQTQTRRKLKEGRKYKALEYVTVVNIQKPVVQRQILQKGQFAEECYPHLQLEHQRH